MLTKKQENMLRIIQDYIDQNGYPPTVRELGERSGISSTSTVHSYIKSIEKEGYLSSVEGLPRTIKILKRI
ncbi:MAG: HTH domain-containing protein [Bacillota bacterium]|nr:HTH domain-containing protein [Bacillota bacterium]